jgi:hypothetical protein
VLSQLSEQLHRKHGQFEVLEADSAAKDECIETQATHIYELKVANGRLHDRLATGEDHSVSLWPTNRRAPIINCSIHSLFEGFNKANQACA